MNANSNDGIGLVFGFFFLAFFLFLIGREIVCWYFKINRTVELLEKIHGSLEEIHVELSRNNQNRY